MLLAELHWHSRNGLIICLPQTTSGLTRPCFQFSLKMDGIHGITVFKWNPGHKNNVFAMQFAFC